MNVTMSMEPISASLRAQVLHELSRRIMRNLVSRIGRGRALAALAQRHSPDDDHFYEVAHGVLRELVSEGAPMDASMLKAVGIRIDPKVPSNARVLEVGEMVTIEGCRAVMVYMRAERGVFRSMMN